MARQAPNVPRMRLLGAEVRAVDARHAHAQGRDQRGHARLGHERAHDTHYLLGSVLGPHPYPTMVRDFQSVIGREARAQMLEPDGRPARRRSSPASAAARTRSASSSRSSTTPACEMVGVEAGGRGSRPGEHAARFAGGRGGVGVLHGTRTLPTPGRGRAACRRRTRSRRASTTRPSGPSTRCCTTRAASRYDSVTDDEALAAFHRLATTEGILPALETAHAVAWLVRETHGARRARRVLVNLTGRGDKDLGIVETPRRGSAA